MKIGILTLPFNNNYGGYLQAYAIMAILKKLGATPELIYRRHNKRSLVWRLNYIIKNSIKIILGRKHGTFIPNREKEFYYKGANMMNFVKTRIIPCTPPIFDTKELQKRTQMRYDAIIVGSDQVWRPDYVPDIQNFFLTFISDKISKVAYAASFGTDTPLYTEKLKLECCKGFANFDFISVREKSGLKVINDLGWKCKRQPEQVLDPTMLLTKDDYEEIVSSHSSESKGKVLSYVLDNNSYIDELRTEISDYFHKDIIDFFHYQKWQDRDYILPSIESWLSSFRDADFIITDSYHGTVFSILFNKPFVAIVNSERGIDRFVSLLSVFGLTKCLYSLGDRYAPFDFNWQDINETLIRERERSLIFLEKSIKHNL